MVAHGVSRGRKQKPNLISPEGDTIGGGLSSLEVSPSGLQIHLMNRPHGSRRGLPSVALRAEELP